jgi:hypothetical protein
LRQPAFYTAKLGLLEANWGLGLNFASSTTSIHVSAAKNKPALAF